MQSHSTKEARLCACGCGKPVARNRNTWIKGHDHIGHSAIPITPVDVRFWRNVQKTETCWLWMGARNMTHYGLLGIDGHSRLAHRISYALLVGPIPDGLDVLHKCDNPPCVNPDHLFLGDAKANAADKIAKGRHITGPSVLTAQLNADQVRQIRAYPRHPGYRAELVRMFGVPLPTIKHVLYGQTYRSVS